MKPRSFLTSSVMSRRPLRSALLVAVAVGLPSFGFAISDGVETFTMSEGYLATEVLAGSEGATVTDVQGWDFTVYSASQNTEVDFAIWWDNFGTDTGLTFDQTTWSADVDFIAFRFSPTDGSLFDLDGVGLNLQLWDGTAVVNNQNVILQGLDVNRDIIAGATLTLAVNDGLLVNFDTSGISQFNQISAFQVSPENGSLFMAYGFVDNIGVSNVIPEPSTTVALVGITLFGLVLFARRRKGKPTSKSV